MPLTISEKIEIGRLCGLYTSNEIASGTKAGGLIDKRLPHLIYAVTQGLVWLYEYDTANADLPKIGNYLISICRHQFKAEGVLALNNGGTVAPITGGGSGTPNDLDFIVSASTIIPIGGTTVNLPQFIGYEVDFARNGTMQYTTPQSGGALYYSWNSVTGDFTLQGTDAAALEGESFRIMVDAGGTGSAAATSAFPFVITSAAFEADGVTLLDSRITGNTVYLLANNTPNAMLFAPTDFTYVAGGIEIILPGFDANTFDYTIVVNKLV